MEVIKSGRCMTQYSTPTEREKIMEQLTLDNPAYKAAKRRSPWGTSNLSPYLFFYERAGRELLMPRNFVPEGVQCHFRYSLNSAPVLYPKFRLELRGDQQLAYEAWEKEKRRDGLFIMQTGKGKTIAALYMAAKARERVLIVVQKNDLIHGWQEDIKLAFGVSEGSIGLIKEKHRRIGRCFTLTTIQTLSKLPASELYEISKNFGMIVQDEIHKAAAASYVCLDHMRVRHLIGFTATPNRNDGLLPLLYWRFGKTIFKSKEQGDADEDIMTFSVRIHETAIQYWPEPEYMKGYRKVSQEEAALYADTHDHALREAPMDAHLRDAAIELNNAYMLKLASDVAAEVKQKKSCLVLFRKKMSIALLKEILIDKKGIPAAYIQEYVGGSKDDGLLKGRAERKEVYVTLATLAKATEGTNVKAWERLFLASSLKNEKDIVQAIGRVRRRTEGKPNVIVYDYRHPGVKGMRTHETNRDKVYRKLKATVEGTEPKRKKGAFSHGFSEIRRR